MIENPVSSNILDEVSGVSGSIKTNNGYINTIVNYKTNIPANYFLYKTNATPAITVDTNVGDITINIDDNTGIVNGEAVTMYEDIRMFQSIVVSTTPTSMTIISPLDYAFTTAAIVECGSWNLNLDGSVTTQICQIKSPPAADLHVHTVGGTMLDQTAMDDSSFGGLPKLTNGIIFRNYNDYDKQYGILLNNTGFFEYGFDITYSTKAPAGYYGLRFRIPIYSRNGAIINLSYALANQLQLLIRDNLTGLDQLTCVVSGNIVDY